MYLFYKTADMKKPRFINIKDYKGNIVNDSKETIISWIKEKHKIIISS